MLASAPLKCPVCGEDTRALTYRVGGSTAVACPKVTPTGAIRWFGLDNLVVVGAGEGVDVPRPRELTPAEKQNLLVKQQQEIDRIEADKRIADQAREIEEKLAAAKGKK